MNCAQNLSHEVCGVIINKLWKEARAGSVHVMGHAIVKVNVVIGVHIVVHGELLVVVRVVPVLLVML